MQGPAEPVLGPEAEVLLRFAAALGLGVLLGLERERTKSADAGFAGVRTFGLIALTGAFSAWAGTALGLGWAAAAAFAAIALLVVASYLISAQKGDIGITTEVGALLAFLIGIACERGEIQIAAAAAVGVVLVLSLKDWLHGLARRIDAEDVTATLQFAIVTLIVLPLLPDRSFGPAPFDVLNPYRIWLMVVLISAVDFASWLLIKILGGQHGIGLTGLLGGLVSSTATTLSFTKRSRQHPVLSKALALGILLAWLVMLARVAVLSAVVWRDLLGAAWPALVAMGVLNLAAVLWLRRGARDGATAEVATGTNPFRLSNALRFGLLFGVVLFAARAAEHWLGSQGVLIAAALTGLTDVDAITLSMGHLAQRDPAQVGLAADAVALAAVSNTLVKGGIAAGAGSAELRRLMLPIALAIALAGAALCFAL